MAETEVAVSQAQLAEILSSVTSGAVLVGGQALAFWVTNYDVALPKALVGAISDDADFLGSRDDVLAIASAVRGTPTFASPAVITALVGQVKIPVSASEFVNVDVLHRLVGVESGKVRDHAAEVTWNDVTFHVMHPLDVLQSRIENLAKLSEKQNEQGIEQARLAVQVAGRYITEIARYPDEGQKHALRLVEQVVGVAKSSAGRRAAREFGVDFWDAIPLYAIESESFTVRRWPRMVKELEVAAGLRKPERGGLSR